MIFSPLMRQYMPKAFFQRRNSVNFFIATKNQHKLSEFRKIFEGRDIKFICESDIGKNMDDPEENGTTFEENAIIKARAGMLFSGMPSVADDSGLCVDALSGAPGIYSARYAGKHGDDKANNNKLLKELEDIPFDKRTARFVCVIACVFPDGREFTVRGECEGHIGFSAEGEKGFGYDPLFISELGCFGSVPADVKNSISHRGQALKRFKAEIEDIIKGDM